MTTLPEPLVPKSASRYAFLYWLAANYLLLNLLSRLGLTWMSWPQGSLSFLDLLYAYGSGLLFDLASLSYLLLPVALWLSLWPMRWRTNRLWQLAGWLMHK